MNKEQKEQALAILEQWQSKLSNSESSFSCRPISEILDEFISDMLKVFNLAIED